MPVLSSSTLISQRLIPSSPTHQTLPGAAEHTCHADGACPCPQEILDQSQLPLNFLVFGGVSAACAVAPVNPNDTYLVGSIPIKACS